MRIEHAAWIVEAQRRFGLDALNWAFVCPVCGRVQTIKECKDAGMSSGMVGFSCIGRAIEGSKDAFAAGDNSNGCTYAGGGLFQLNPVEVEMPDGEIIKAFAFADVKP